MFLDSKLECVCVIEYTVNLIRSNAWLMSQASDLEKVSHVLHHSFLFTLQTCNNFFSASPLTPPLLFGLTFTPCCCTCCPTADHSLTNHHCSVFDWFDWELQAKVCFELSNKRKYELNCVWCYCYFLLLVFLCVILLLSFFGTVLANLSESLYQ